MTQMDEVAFLVDVDNTLLDNDRFRSDLSDYLIREGGQECRDRYFTIEEGLFHSLGYRDYLGAFQQFRKDWPDEMEVIWLAEFVVSYPYDQLVYPGATELLARLRGIGPTALLTDGDAVFQPRKLLRSGLADAAGRRALIYVHKEAALDDVARRVPARRYVVIDDKLRLLTAIKSAWGERVTTVFPRQGQFALDEKVVSALPPADLTVERIGDLLDEPLLARLAGPKLPLTVPEV